MDKVALNIRAACEVYAEGPATTARLEAVADAYSHAIAEAHEQEMAGQAEGSVALYDALDGLCKAVWYGTDEDRQAAYDKGQQALAAATYNVRAPAEELAQLRGKVARLTETLGIYACEDEWRGEVHVCGEVATLPNLYDDPPEWSFDYDTGRSNIFDGYENGWELAQQALEDAPEVLFSDKGHIQYIEPHEHCDGQGETRVSLWAGYIRLGPGKMYEEGREVDVCACLPSGEQQQNGEQEGSGE